MSKKMQELRSILLLKKSKGVDVRLFKNNLRLSVLFMCLKISDLLITIIALPLGAIEGNPIGQIFLNNSLYILPYFIFLSVICILTTYFFYKYKMHVFSRILLMLLLMLNILAFYILINNLFVFYRLVI